MKKEIKIEPNICNVCQEPRLQYAFSAHDYITDENFELWLCPDCQAMATMPRLNDEELQKYYQGIYYGRRKSFVDQFINNERVWTIKKLYKTYLKNYSFGHSAARGEPRLRRERGEESHDTLSSDKPEILHFVQDDNMSILDIGCGNGLFLNGLKKIGWKIAGTELAPESHVHPDISPFVCNKPVNECTFTGESFDIITMWHTLEHFINPSLYLRDANRILKRSGVLIIEVPNFKSWQFLITGKHWFPLEIPRHRTHFSPQAIKIILEKTEFQIVRISYGNFFYDVFGFTQSILNSLCRQKNILFNILNGKLSASINGVRSVFDVFITVVLTPPLSIIGIILFFIEIATKHGGTMRIYSKKTS